MADSGGIIILSTFPDEKSILKTSREVVRSNLCACVNFTKIRSVYTWKGKMEEADEIVAFFKTTKTRAKELKKRIMELHPYEVPEIVELKMADVSKKYLEWMTQSTIKKD